MGQTKERLFLYLDVTDSGQRAGGRKCGGSKADASHCSLNQLGARWRKETLMGSTEMQKGQWGHRRATELRAKPHDGDRPLHSFSSFFF